MDAAEVLGRARDEHLRLVRFLYCDHANIIRGKAAHASALADCIESGIGLTVAMQAFCLTEHLAPGTNLGPVGEIRLVPDVNAAVSEATRPFALGPSTRRMFLGAPLLQGVSRNQLRAVLAHELGHHSTADARVGGLVHRGRLAIAEIAAGLTHPLLKRPFRTYARLFFALTRPLALSHEINADRLSAKVVGAPTAAVTLRTLPALDAAWRIYLEQYVDAGTHDGLRPTRLFDNFTQMMSDPSRLDQLAQLSTELPEANASAYDSHPPLNERVERLAKEVLPSLR